MSETDLSHLLDQILDLPAEAQAELMETLIDMRAQQFGIYQLDEDDRASPARSAEDIQFGRVASPNETEQVHAHGA